MSAFSILQGYIVQKMGSTSSEVVVAGSILVKKERKMAGGGI